MRSPLWSRSYSGLSYGTKIGHTLCSIDTINGILLVRNIVSSLSKFMQQDEH